MGRGEALWVFYLCAPHCGHPVKAEMRTLPCGLRATCQVFSNLLGLWGALARGEVGGGGCRGGLKWGSLVTVLAVPSPRPTLAHTIHVVWSCYPGPGLSRAR